MNGHYRQVLRDYWNSLSPWEKTNKFGPIAVMIGTTAWCIANRESHSRYANMVVGLTIAYSCGRASTKLDQLFSNRQGLESKLESEEKGASS